MTEKQKLKKSNTLKSLMTFLKANGEDGKRISSELKKVKCLSDKNTFSTLLKLLTHLDYSENEAKIYWDKILKHKELMDKKLNRNVGVRVSIVDFFLNIERQLDNPKLIEISLYRETEKLVIVDTLTGLFNYHFFTISLNKEIDKARRIGIPLTVLLLDIDNFKQYNDMFGHLNGDQVLRIVSKVMQYNIRESDAIFRYGGEEFAVILSNTDKTGAQIPAKRLLKAVRNFAYKDEKIPLEQTVTISCGVASYPVDGKDSETLIGNADKALYRAKFEGKDRACLFSPEQRRFFRLSLDCGINYEPLAAVSGMTNAKLVNISEGGIAFLSKDFIAPKTDLKIQIHIDATSPPLEVIGRVIRSVKISTSKKYYYKIGFEFVKLDQNAKFKIKKFVKNKNSQKRV